MYIDWQSIITFGSVVSALLLVIGLIIKAHNLVLEVRAGKKEIAELRIEFEERISKLEKHHEDDVHRINEENCLVCFALSACLDGLRLWKGNCALLLVRISQKNSIRRLQHHPYRVVLFLFQKMVMI